MLETQSLCVQPILPGEEAVFLARSLIFDKLFFCPAYKAGEHFFSEQIQVKSIDMEVFICWGCWLFLISSEILLAEGRWPGVCNQVYHSVLAAFGSVVGLCCVLVLISNLIKPGSSAWQVVYPALAIHASQFIFIVLIKPQVIFQVQIVFSIIGSWPAHQSWRQVLTHLQETLHLKDLSLANFAHISLETPMTGQDD